MSSLRRPLSGGPPRPAQQPPADPARELDETRAIQAALGRTFLVANGGGFAVMALLAATVGNSFGTRVLGVLPLGLLLCLLQLALLMLTAWLHERASRARVDPRTGGPW